MLSIFQILFSIKISSNVFVVSIPQFHFGHIFNDKTHRAVFFFGASRGFRQGLRLLASKPGEVGSIGIGWKQWWCCWKLVRYIYIYIYVSSKHIYIYIYILYIYILYIYVLCMYIYIFKDRYDILYIPIGVLDPI